MTTPLPDEYRCQILILTLSDRAFRQEYPDRSGPAVAARLEQFFREQGYAFEITAKILPDEANLLADNLKEAFERGTDLIITTGGTGIGPRDITVSTVTPLLDYTLPGIMEMIRVKYGQNMPSALLSRSIAGVRGRTLVFTLPGSVRATGEYLDVILPLLQHAFHMLHGNDIHHA